jgi:hypothetical protein
MSAERYRRSAEDCRQRADRATTPDEAESYREMALIWDRLAVESEVSDARWRVRLAQDRKTIIPFDREDPARLRKP